MKKIILFLFLVIIITFSGCKKENNIIDLNNTSNVIFCKQFIKVGHYFPIRSNTYPKINETHIFCGEINKLGKPVGFHSRPNGINPPTAKIEKIIDKNNLGIYQAQVKILDIKENKRKTKFSTVFPDKYTMKDIINMIIHAYKNKYFLKGSKFRGPSGKGFDIEGYLIGKDKINTAYPIFKN